MISLYDSYSDFMIDQRVRGNSPKTLTYYSVALSFFRCFMDDDFDVSELTLQDCKNYYLYLVENKDVNSVSIQSYIRALRSFLNWLYENEYITTNICDKFKLPKATRKVIDVLSDEEIYRVFSALDGEGWILARNRLIIALMLDSGLRLNEVVTLQLSSVHLKERYMIVTGKGDKQRTVPFGESTAALLTAYLDAVKFARIKSNLIIKVSDIDCGFVPITDTAIKNMFRKLKRKSGVYRLYPHLLRHTFATRYLENGGNIYTLQAILGHTSLEMVKRYLHLATTRIRADFPQFSPLDNIKKTPL